MPKRCIICKEEAVLMIKDTSDYYCQPCAEENFADLSYLQKIEEQKETANKAVEEAIDDDENLPEGN